MKVDVVLVITKELILHDQLTSERPKLIDHEDGDSGNALGRNGIFTLRVFSNGMVKLTFKEIVE